MIESMNNVTAAIIIIGNEILSGRTADQNTTHLAKELGKIGVNLSEVRVIPDAESEIIKAVNELRVKYSYVFTTGGIGPTHDDITAASVAKAFTVKLLRNPEALKLLQSHYGSENLNEARLKMADIPEGAKLIANPISTSPGFYLENVFVFAGVPTIMQAMFDNVRSVIKGGDTTISKTITTDLTEGAIAKELGELQNSHPEIEIGSYPYLKDGSLGVSLVIRGVDKQIVSTACKKLENLVIKLGGKLLSHI